MFRLSLDGQEFLMVQAGPVGDRPGFTLIQNWTEELKRLVPVN